MRAKRIDANQSQIIADLRKMGYSVADTSGVGGGYPDLNVGGAGHNFLFEIKDGTKPPSERKLTPQQEDWHRDWRGQVNTIETTEDALKVIRKRIWPSP